MFTFDPSGIATGLEAGINRRNTQEDRQLKQEQLKTQYQQQAEKHAMDMRTNNNANYEMDLLRGKIEEQAAQTKQWKSATMAVNAEQAQNAYIGSLSAQTFNDDKFGGDISMLQNFSRIASPDKKPPQVPNAANDAQVKQVISFLTADMSPEQLEGMDPVELDSAAKRLMMSGEYIAVGEDSEMIVPIDKVFGAIGASMNKEATTKWDNFLKVKNQYLYATTAKLQGDGSEGDGQLKLYSQIESDKKLRDSILEDGGEVPQALTNRIAHNENVYNKENLGAGEAAAQAKNTREYNQAVKAEQDGTLYKGGAEDVQTFNTSQVKDKEKKFAAVQDKVESARTFHKVKQRINEILSQASIDRDAVSNLGYKIKQYLGDDIAKYISGEKSTKDILGDRKAMAAFNRIETAIGYPMVQLIKDISGAAVTNEEREYLMNLVIGGEFKNMDALTEKLDEFSNIQSKNAVKALNKKITGGKALRPNWGNTAEKEMHSYISSGKVGSTLKEKKAPVYNMKDENYKATVKKAFDSKMYKDKPIAEIKKSKDGSVWVKYTDGVTEQIKD